MQNPTLANSPPPFPSLTFLPGRSWLIQGRARKIRQPAQFFPSQARLSLEGGVVQRDGGGSSSSRQQGGRGAARGRAGREEQPDSPTLRVPELLGSAGKRRRGRLCGAPTETSSRPPGKRGSRRGRRVVWEGKSDPASPWPPAPLAFFPGNSRSCCRSSAAFGSPVWTTPAREPASQLGGKEGSPTGGAAAAAAAGGTTGGEARLSLPFRPPSSSRSQPSRRSTRKPGGSGTRPEEEKRLCPPISHLFRRPPFPAFPPSLPARHQQHRAGLNDGFDHHLHPIHRRVSALRGAGEVSAGGAGRAAAALRARSGRGRRGHGGKPGL